MATKYVSYLKFMRPDRYCTHAWNNGKPLPEDVWLPRRNPKPCESGYHFCRNYPDVASWTYNGELWLVNVKGKRNDDYNKGCAAQLKLVKKLELPDTPWLARYKDATYHPGLMYELRAKAMYWGNRTYSKDRFDRINVKNWHRTMFGKCLDNILTFNDIDPKSWGDN